MSGFKLSAEAKAAAAALPSGDGLVAYFEDVMPVGGFLTAVLENNLMKAANEADGRNRKLLAEYAAWLFNFAPIGGYGSREKVDAWYKNGGLPKEPKVEILTLISSEKL